MPDTMSAVLARIDALQAELAELRALVSSREQHAADAGDDGAESRTGSAPAAGTSRRGLLRMGAVAVGAAAATLAPTSTEAANGDPVRIGLENLGSDPTLMTSTSGGVVLICNTTITDAVVASSGVGRAFLGVGGAYGVHGVANTAAGIGAAGQASHSTGSTLGLYGTVASPAGIGVYGRNEAGAGAAVGVRGETVSPNGFGLHGVQPGGIAVLGEIPGSTDRSGIALYGLNNSAFAGPAPGAGGFGVYGLSAKGHGLVGATAASGAAAVVGAINGVAGAYAGAFYGPVVVTGAFTVFGAKSAAVPHPDGSHRRLYCVESPESWFEDFGEGTLACGEAAVRLEPEFAALVDTAAYHVFLTGHDGRSDLSVSARTADGFRVTASSGAGDGTFSWRVVAKRKDIEGPRLERVATPAEPALPQVPVVAPAHPRRPAAAETQR
jgi:hypothetical protein